MLVIESRNKKSESILKKYPEAVILDVTSKAKDEMVKLSPFYPHWGIPIPFTPGRYASCVEAVWQGLKVFENYGIDRNVFENGSMKNIKRSIKKYGKLVGHNKGVYGVERLGYLTARHEIYAPTYKWMLENKVRRIVEKIREMSESKTVVLLDYNTNCNIDDPRKPLSHAYLIKAYIEGLYPYGEKKEAA